MICPTCRYCADHGLPRLCITRGGSLRRLLNHAIDEGCIADFEDLVEQLLAHPTQPLAGWTPDQAFTRLPTLRHVDRTWCDAGAEDRPATPQQAATPRTREAQPA